MGKAPRGQWEWADGVHLNTVIGSTEKRLAGLFVAMVVVPGAGMGWLGWRSLQQEGALARQRRLERSEATAALLRLGRTLRKMGDPARAMNAYEWLAALEDATVAGLPAPLLGRHGLMTVAVSKRPRAEFLAAELDR